jgi:hypothetical protein
MRANCYLKKKTNLITLNKLHQYMKQKVQLLYAIDASKDQRNN